MIWPSRSGAIRLLFRNVVPLFVLLACVLSATIPRAQTVDIKLVNGRNGLPMARTCINVWLGDERKQAMAIPTDSNGVARLRLTTKDSEIDVHEHWKGCGDFEIIDPVVKYTDSIRINVGYVLWQPHAPDYSWLLIAEFSTKEILQHGISRANTCGKATATPRRGELILFVRPLSWWEKLKQ